jgi:hypothetical protein
MMNRYVISVKREMWGRVKLEQVLGQVETIPGYRVVGSTSGRRTIVEASASAAKQIRAALENVCYIEPEIQYISQGVASR